MQELKAEITLTDGHENIETDVLTGNLNSIIISSSDKVDIIITSDYGYPILKTIQFTGINYFAPRKRTTSAEENIMDINEFDKFLLNEKLQIVLMGPKNAVVSIIIRLD